MTVADGGSWEGLSSHTKCWIDRQCRLHIRRRVSFTILGLRVTNSGYLDLHLNKAPDRNWGLVLNVGDVEFRLAEAALFRGNYEGVIAGWAYANQGETPPMWSVDDTVTVSLGEPAPAAVKLSVRPNPVREGSWVSVEACLLKGNGNRAVPQGTVRIPVTLSHGTGGEPLGGRRLGGCRSRATRTTACRSARRTSSPSSERASAAAASSTSRRTGTATPTTRPSRWR